MTFWTLKNYKEVCVVLSFVEL